MEQERIKDWLITVNEFPLEKAAQYIADKLDGYRLTHTARDEGLEDAKECIKKLTTESRSVQRRKAAQKPLKPSTANKGRMHSPFHPKLENKGTANREEAIIDILYEHYPENDRVDPAEVAKQILALMPKALSDEEQVKIVMSEIREWARIHKRNRVCNEEAK